MKLYTILGLTPDATTADIKKAFKRLASKHHPDKNNGMDDGAFVEIQKAYEVLSKAESRSRYDETGSVEEGPSLISRACNAISGTFITLASRQDYKPKDYFKVVRSTILASREACARDLKKSELMLKNYLYLLNNSDMHDLLRENLKLEISELEGACSLAKDALDVMGCALDILRDECSYNGVQGECNMERETKPWDMLPPSSKTQKWGASS